MTLLKNKVSAKIYAEILILKNLPDKGFPLNLGALTLRLGGRNFILDAEQTNFKNGQRKGSKITFDTSLGLALDTFPIEGDDNYELTEADLKDKKLKGEFFCMDDDAGIEEAFDFANAKLQCSVFVDGKEYKVNVVLE